VTAPDPSEHTDEVLGELAENAGGVAGPGPATTPAPTDA
jgi:hypothetical protein